MSDEVIFWLCVIGIILSPIILASSKPKLYKASGVIKKTGERVVFFEGPDHDDVELVASCGWMSNGLTDLRIDYGPAELPPPSEDRWPSENRSHPDPWWTREEQN